ncbi:MAG: aldehyde dehydrogenase family protein [Cyanobacteria bacterium P01_F01_bin.42]
MDIAQQTEEQILLRQVKQSAGVIQAASSHQRDEAVKHLIEKLESRIDDILEANTLDLETSRDLALPSILLTWLRLTPQRLREVCGILEQVLDPFSFSAQGTFAQSSGQLVHYSPVGVIGFIYEALPELALILSGMCLKTGNALVLRGGTETSHTNRAIADVIQSALDAAKLPSETIVSLPASRRATVETLVKQNSGIDLVIPYGRPTLVQQVSHLSEIPTLRTSIGNCYLFWSSTGSLEQVQHVISRSHQGHPEAVNAVDKVIVPTSLQRPLLNLLWDNLEEEGFEIQGDQELCSDLPNLTPADPSVWGQPSLGKVLAFKLVDSLQQGVQWMNTYSSGHADCIVSDSSKEIHQFITQARSASVFVNRAPEFSRLKGEFRSSPAFCMAKRGGISAGVIDLYSLLKTQEVYQGT